VLILDDDADFNSLLTDIFEQANYVVTSMEDPVEAVGVFADNHYDIVVTDYKMPEMTGAEFMVEIKKLKPEVPVVMVSGFLENDTIRELISDGVGGVFLKPLNIFSLLERTAELIDEAQKLQPSQGGESIEEEVKESDAVHGQIGFSFRSFPCKSPVSAGFAERLYSLRNFKCAISLIGVPGTHYRTICEDVRGFYESDKEQFIYLTPGSFDAQEALAQVMQAQQDGLEQVTCVLLELERMSDEQRKLAVQLVKCEGEFESIQTALRAIFCVSGDLDSLYDEGVIDENLYILMGTAEVQVPSLADCSADVPFIAQQIVAELTTERGLSTVPRFDKGGRDFLKTYSWPRNHDELYAALRKLMESEPPDIITNAALQSVVRSMVVASPHACFMTRLSRVRVDYVRAVSVLLGGDNTRVATFFGTEVVEIEGILK
ncbi:MAG: response regulator, partial [Coraliomargarita sp.]